MNYEEAEKLVGKTLKYNGSIDIPFHYIWNYDKLTAKQILQENNVEIRRFLIQLMGTDRFLFEGGAEEQAKDEYGTILTLRFDDAEFYYVEVINSTKSYVDANITEKQFSERIKNTDYDELVRKKSDLMQNRSSNPTEYKKKLLIQYMVRIGNLKRSVIDEIFDEWLKLQSEASLNAKLLTKDGYKRYYVEIPEEIVHGANPVRESVKFAKKAVAWTFGETVDTYNPEVQT